MNIMTRAARQASIANGVYDPALMFNRGLIAQTGCIPEGSMLLQDVWPLVIKDIKNVVSESVVGGTSATRVTGVFQVADDTNANGRVYPRSILKEAVGAIQEDITNRSVWGEFDHPCMWVSNSPGEGGIRILTVCGWKDFEDIKVGDRVLSRRDNKMVSSRVNAITNESFNGDLYHFKGRNIDTLFTPGHRFLLLNQSDCNKNNEIYRTSEDLFINDKEHSIIPRTAKWEGDRPLFITIPGIKENDILTTQDLHIETSAFCAFLGVYLASGNCNKNGLCVDILNTDSMISEMLDRLHQDIKYNSTENGFKIHDARLCKWLKQCGDFCDKHIPTEIKQLDSEHLDELVYWFAVGNDCALLASDKFLSLASIKSDTNVDMRYKLDLVADSDISVFSISKSLIDDLHECVLKVGGCCESSIVDSDEDYHYCNMVAKSNGDSLLYKLSLSKNSDIDIDSKFLSIEKTNKSCGRIQCLTVDNGNFYMEQNGHSFWTGNSDAKIHLDRISHLITKIWMEGKSVFGEAEIISELPYGSQLSTLLGRGRIGISSRGIGDMEIRENGGQELHFVTEGYRFVTWDAVAEPSVTGAILQLIEGKLKPIKQSKAKPAIKLTHKPAYDRMLSQEVQKYLNNK